jgi:hypothetical protein
MTDQPTLFDWKPATPSNVIDAKARFQHRAYLWVKKAIETGTEPPHIGGKVITIPKRGAA